MERYCFIVVIVSLIFVLCSGIVIDENSDPRVIPGNCISCLCEGLTKCSVKKKCDGEVCGPFRITYPYWVDAGKPMPQSILGMYNDQINYRVCSLNHICAARTIRSYMGRYVKDCNNNGRIDCMDFLAIHMLGPMLCHQWRRLDQQLVNRIQQCLRELD